MSGLREFLIGRRRRRQAAELFVGTDRVQAVLAQSEFRALKRLRRAGGAVAGQAGRARQAYAQPVPDVPSLPEPHFDCGTGVRISGGATALAEPIQVVETVSAVLRRQVPIRSDESPRSWFGGLPMMPETVPWPRATMPDQLHKGDVPLHFLAQLCCSDLPEDLWGGLGPRDGWLLFFVNPRTCALDGNGNGCRVIHTRTLGVERQPPEDLGPVHDGVCAGSDYGYLQGTGDVPALWRRWPLDLVMVPNAIPDPKGLKVTPEGFASTLYARLDVSDDQHPPAPAPFTERMALAVLSFISARLAKHPLKPDLPETVVDGLRDSEAFARLVPDLPAQEQAIADLRLSLEQADRAERADDQERLRHMEGRLDSQKRLAALLERYPSAEALRTYCADAARANDIWRQNALRDLRDMRAQFNKDALDTPLTPAEWRGIQDYLKYTRTSQFNFLDFGEFSSIRQRFAADEDQISLWSLYDVNHLRLWEYVADYYTDPERRHLVPEDVLAQFLPCWRHLYDNRAHRSGGAFDALQSAPQTGPTSHVTLLHVASDTAMNWLWGDAGILYVTISAQDLADGAFEHAAAVMECY